jgi:GAF domain-containing protein
LEAGLAEVACDPARLAEVLRLGLLDVDRADGADAELGRVVREAAIACGTPTALLSVVLDDAQLVLAAHGLDGAPHLSDGYPVEWSFCRFTLTRPDAVLEIPDANADPRVADNPLVRQDGVRAYLGAPLVTSGGQPLGALCAIDVRPREFDEAQAAVLRRLADRVARALEARVAGATAPAA